MAIFAKFECKICQLEIVRNTGVGSVARWELADADLVVPGVFVLIREGGTAVTGTRA